MPGMASSGTALPLDSCIGFNGGVDGGLVLEKDGTTIIYPLGSTIIVRQLENDQQQTFLQGHTDEVSCLVLSPSGRYLASGQLNFMGLKADIIIWDLTNMMLLHHMSLHKVKVQALAFSCDEQFLASLGGQDDNALVLWDVETGNAICGTPTCTDFTVAIKFLNNDGAKLVTCGNYNLNVWQYDHLTNKLVPSDVQLGQLRRCFTCLAVDAADQYMYCGTATGDVLQINLERKLLRNSGPAKGLVQQGVVAVALTPSGDIIVGGGDGILSIMKHDQEGQDARFLNKMPLLASTKLGSRISTLTVDHAHSSGRALSMVCGTHMCDKFRVTYDLQSKKLQAEMLQTSPPSSVHDVAFPHEYSEVFAACGLGEIRVWHLHSRRELLRMSVPNLDCRCVAFMQDGQSIISGWSDGKIRAFGPQSGKLLYTIHDAHQGAVTAISGTPDSTRIISGGEEGMVRMWAIHHNSQVMEASMKEHKGAVNCIKVKASKGDECVTASSDGSCIIWDLTTFHRRSSLFANTLFKAALYHPDESQLVTAGTDRKIMYWDAFEGSAIRELEGSSSEQVSALAIDSEGEAIVSGGGDKLVKLWGYDEGNCYAMGTAHSGSVNRVAVTPDKSHVVSVGSEGAIMIWNYVAPSLTESSLSVAASRNI